MSNKQKKIILLMLIVWLLVGIVYILDLELHIVVAILCAAAIIYRYESLCNTKDVIDR